MRAYSVIDRGRGPELEGTRITVFDVLHYLEVGHSPTYIASILNLSTPAVMALIHYFENHKDEILAQNHAIIERLGKGNPPDLQNRLKGSRSHELIEERLAEFRRRVAGGETQR